MDTCPAALIVTREAAPMVRPSMVCVTVVTPPVVADVKRELDEDPSELANTAPAVPFTVSSTPPTLPAKMFCG